jgi:uncharacterized protein YndB with AHSA1/START domain
MAGFSSEVFRSMTSASAEQVWDALTATGRPLDHLYGLAACSDWQVASTVSLGLPGRPPLVGDVLAVEPGRRLSYSLGEEPGQATVYVTWEIAPHACGAVIQLTVDEPDAGTSDEIEACWRPVIDALAAHLDQRASSA